MDKILLIVDPQVDFISGSLNLTSEVITVGGIANARNSIFKLMKSNLISSNVSEECVTDKEFINFNDTY